MGMNDGVERAELARRLDFNFKFLTSSKQVTNKLFQTYNFFILFLEQIFTGVVFIYFYLHKIKSSTVMKCEGSYSIKSTATKIMFGVSSNTKDSFC